MSIQYLRYGQKFYFKGIIQRYIKFFFLIHNRCAFKSQTKALSSSFSYIFAQKFIFIHIHTYIIYYKFPAFSSSPLTRSTKTKSTAFASVSKAFSRNGSRHNWPETEMYKWWLTKCWTKHNEGTHKSKA